MKQLPEILITGFPNSGTSFLCNLIVALGKSPGNQNNLKKGDGHNRWGYFENLKLREVAYKALPQGYFSPWEKGHLPDKPYLFHTEKIKKYSCLIAEAAKKNNVEVYKDNSIPLIFRIFPKEAKFINIKRSPKKCYKSPKKGGHSQIPCSFKEFFDCYNKYQDLVRQMAKEVDCLEINYEDFHNDFKKTLYKITQYLGIEIDEQKLKECKKIFRPRKNLREEILKKFYTLKKIFKGIKN